MNVKLETILTIAFALLLFSLFWFIPKENVKFGTTSEYELMAYHLKTQRYSLSSYLDVLKLVALSGAISGLLGVLAAQVCIWTRGIFAKNNYNK